MAQAPEEGFRVTDRRQRDAIDAPPSSSASPGRHPGPPPSGPTPHAPSPDRSLVGLFLMLATEALIALGETPNPLTGQRQRELPHAAGVIDLLALLREKTEGHRSVEETKTLDELVYDLQLRYVAAVKSSG